jgi:hypothetical protein
MSILVIRPDSWNFPLILHVAGAMVMVGTLILAAGALMLAARSAAPADGAALTRFGFRTLLVAAIPSYIVMRVAAEWIYSKEFNGSNDPGWVGIGYITSDSGALLLLIGTILTGIASRKLGRDPERRTVLGRVGVVLLALLLVSFTVAIWAMTTKPS